MSNSYENAIELKNVTKKYDGFTLDNVSFNVPKGSIMGFIGQNGAGKTTLDVESYDIDCVLPVTINGETYAQPFRKESIKVTYFDESGFSGFASDFIGGYIMKFAPIFEEKGVLPALADMGLNLEELLGGLYLLLVDEAHMAETAIGKLVDNGSAYPLSQEVVDDSTQVGTDGCTYNNHYEAHFAKVGCRRYDNFRWKGDK